MTQRTTSATRIPEARSEATAGSGPVDREVVEFRAQFESRSPLDEIVREGARQMLQAAIEAEVTEFVSRHEDRRDDHGRRLVVRNGHLPAREVLTGAGPLRVTSNASL